MAAAHKPLKLVLGAMEFGRYASFEQSVEMVNAFLGAGHKEIDSAFMYSGGKSETYLGQMKPVRDPKNNVLVATKANPWSKQGLKYERVLEEAKISLQDRMKMDSCDIFYLHAPDHNTPIAETLKAVQELYEQKKFKRFGLSNYASWQVVEIYYICKQNGWVLPTVYQGMYNAITRGIEDELLPALRHLGISFYAYNPLAGGILTGKHKFEDTEAADDKPKGRFFGNDWAETYRGRYWKKENFDAIDAIKSACGDDITVTGASLRWLSHHSALKPEHGDAIILGASKLHHLTENLETAVAGPLNSNAVAAFDAAWDLTRASCPKYFR